MGNHLSVVDYKEANIKELAEEEAVVAFGRRFCSPEERQVVVTDRPMDGHPVGFKAIDKDDQDVRLFHTQIDIMKDEYFLFDSEGGSVGGIKHKEMSLHLETYLHDAEGRVVAVVRKAKFVQAHAEIYCWILESPAALKGFRSDPFISMKPHVVVKGNWRARHMLIYNQALDVIGKSHRYKSKLRKLLDKDVYSCRVGKNVDAALVMTLILIVDEMYQDHKD